MYQILPSNLLYPFLIIIFSIFSLLSLVIFFNMSHKNKNSKESSMTIQVKKIKLSESFLGLFVSFDSHSSINFLSINELNWIMVIFVTLILFYSFWVLPNRISFFMKSMLLMLSKQFLIALKSKKDGSNLIFCTIFLLFIYSNLMGLIPNVFTPSSHLTFNLMFSIPLWVGFFLYGWFTYFNKMFAHLVPLSTPIPLISFMVLIELISTLIRPSTLSIRLMANMVSGHILLTLIGNNFSLSNLSFFFILIFVQTLLMLLEVGVSMIQAYVFSILLTLYSDESDYSLIH